MNDNDRENLDKDIAYLKTKHGENFISKLRERIDEINGLDKEGKMALERAKLERAKLNWEIIKAFRDEKHEDKNNEQTENGKGKRNQKRFKLPSFKIW